MNCYPEVRVFKINTDSLKKAVEYLIRRAEGWQPIGSGECQLYGRYDDDGVIRELFVRDFAGHNSWVEDPDIVRIMTFPWFSWEEHEDLGEWLWNELENDSELKSGFLKWLRETEEIAEFSDVSRYLLVDLFQRFDREKWEKLLDEWRDVWLEEYIHDQTVRVEELLENHWDRWIVDDDVPPAELEWEGE